MMQRKIIWVSVLVLALFIGGMGVTAQTTGVSSAEEALSNALSVYMGEVGELGLWNLGDVIQDGYYAYSLARHVEKSNIEEGNLLLLAKMAQDGLWYTRTPFLDSAESYNTFLNSFPAALFSEFEKSYFYQYTADDFSFLEGRAVASHRFPWPIQETARLTQKDGSYHTNQLDFVLRNSANVYASKPGVVIFKKESSSVGGCDMELWEYANMVVVQHPSGEFSWYYHLAPNSVPVEVGDSIGYGTKVGEQGNTGFACGTTGIHLHFMVSTVVPSYWPDPDNPALAPWPPSGTIVQVDFLESTWSSLVEGTIYTSQNAPPPGICSASVSKVNFYDGTYCSSYLNQVVATGLYDLAGLSSENKVESIEIPDGQSVRLYQEFNEVGQYVCLNGTDEMLWDNAFQNGDTVANRASWLRVFSEPNCPLDFSAGVLFYADINFLGDPVWGMVGERSTDAPNHIVKSIIIPNGYSLKIWDQDGFIGNSLCMVSPVTDLSAFSWDNQQIESLQFAAGDICDGQEIDGKIPYLISPEHNAVLYGLKTPEFCWGASSQESLEFFVELKKGDGTTYTSGWISDSCWLAEDVTGIFGEYDWKVKSRTSDEDVSPWSLTYHLSYLEDIVDPTVSIIMPIEGIDVVYPRTVFRAEANDLGGVKFVYFFAWYDDGSGNGHDWHYLDVDENEADGWEIIWNLLPVAHPDTALYIVAYDYSGNDSYDLITQINVGESFTFGDGFESRGARDSVTESQNLVPTTFPELPGSSIDSEPIESGTGAQNQNEARNAPFEQPPLPSDESASQSELPAEAGLPVELIEPLGGNWYWGEQTPNLCWSPATGAAFYKLSVTGEDNAFKSQWIEDTCVHPLEIQGIAGEYQWQVKYKGVNGNQSEWSASKTFYIREDLSIPEVAILDAEYAAVENSGGLQLSVSTEAVDNESGIEAVYLLAYFDDGNGVSWHKLGELHDPAAAHHQFIWKFDNPEVNIQQLWAYAIDVAGNTGAASLLGTEIAHDLQTDSSMQHYQKGLIDYAYIRLKQSDTD